MSGDFIDTSSSSAQQASLDDMPDGVDSVFSMIFYVMAMSYEMNAFLVKDVMDELKENNDKIKKFREAKTQLNVSMQMAEEHGEVDFDTAIDPNTHTFVTGTSQNDSGFHSGGNSGHRTNSGAVTNTDLAAAQDPNGINADATEEATIYYINIGSESTGDIDDDDFTQMTYAEYIRRTQLDPNDEHYIDPTQYQYVSVQGGRARTNQNWTRQTSGIMHVDTIHGYRAENSVEERRVTNLSGNTNALDKDMPITLMTPAEYDRRVQLWKTRQQLEANGVEIKDGKVDTAGIQSMIDDVDNLISELSSDNQLQMVRLQNFVNNMNLTMNMLTQALKAKFDSDLRVASNTGA